MQFRSISSARYAVFWCTQRPKETKKMSNSLDTIAPLREFVVGMTELVTQESEEKNPKKQEDVANTKNESLKSMDKNSCFLRKY